ncbi:MAG: copper-translocating P-type ATPase, partial [Flavobacteriaceae bacterium]
ALHEEALREASRQLDSMLVQTDFVIPDHVDGRGIATVEGMLGALPQVRRVRANLTFKTVSVMWDPGRGQGTAIAVALHEAGFPSTVRDLSGEATPEHERRGRMLLLSLAVAGFAAANIMLLSVSVWSGASQETAQLFHLISGLIAVPAVAFAGRPFFLSAAGALAARRLNMDVPISLAVLMATGMSVVESLRGGEEAYFDAAVMLLFFLLIGRYLDETMREKARGAVERLARLSARSAMLVGEGGETRFVPVDTIRPGMLLRILPGERAPVDCEVVAGASDIDRSLVSGESRPLRAADGTVLEAGVVNLTGSLDVRALREASASFLAGIVSMMQAAEHGRTRYVRIADRMARLYAPVVHLLAFATFLAWAVSGAAWTDAIYTAIAVLIITCPCALGLAVPVAHVVAANRLLADGVLLRDGSALERLAAADHVVFDKTGTLTAGEPAVCSVEGLEPSHEPVVRALAGASRHPLSRAIRVHLGDGAIAALESVAEVPGHGVEGIWRGTRVRLGRPDWAAGGAAEGSADEDAGGSSLVAFAAEGENPATFALDDALRPDAAAAVARLREGGLAVEIASGDTARAVAATADAAGIACFRAGMTPRDKLARLADIQAGGHKVLMVGDGLNDAPSLAAADVSMAPASASDVGRLAADFVFIRPGLMAVARARETARAADIVVRQNFAIAIAYNCVAVPLAMAGAVTPLVAAIAMSASSVAVVANSLRLAIAGRERAAPAAPRAAMGREATA